MTTALRGCLETKWRTAFGRYLLGVFWMRSSKVNKFKSVKGNILVAN